jgi:Cdc6-like AAA superfamily ATPase
MTDASANLRCLSEAAATVLDYLIRYRAQRGVALPKEFLGRTMNGAYPLFRYLFPSNRFLGTLVEEVERAGGFEGDPPPETKERERVRQAARDYIRLQCADIFGRIPLSNVCEIVESAPKDENVERLIDRLRFLGLCDLRAGVHLSKQYTKALLEVGAGSGIEKQNLIDSFAGLIGMQPIRDVCLEEPCELPFGLYQTADLVPNSNFRVAIALLNGEGDTEQQQRAAIRFAETFRVENIAFLLLGHSDSLVPRMEAFAAERRAILLKDCELKRIGLSVNPQEAMRECIFPQLPPSALSPFRSKGPVTGDGFFGRRAELRRMQGTPNVVLLGARRIGKTSLLKTLRDEVNSARGQDGTIAVFVDAGADRRLEWFQKNLMQGMLEEAERAGVEMGWIDPGEAFFEELATALKRSTKKFLFLIDEADHLVLDPEIGLLEEFVRSMSNTSRARFVLSGYMNLRQRTENRDSFLYNLFTTIVLGPLARRDAAELVRTQMKRIYVGIESDQVVEDILNLGSTLAAYVQCMCDLLLKRLDEPGRKRIITSADVSEVYRSEKFSREITSAVTDSTEQALGPLARLILYWAAAREDEHFTEKDLLEDLGRTIPSLRFSEVGTALNYLTVTYLLNETQGKYSFYTSLLRKKMREVEDIDALVSYLVREFRDQQGRR